MRIIQERKMNIHDLTYRKGYSVLPGMMKLDGPVFHDPITARGRREYYYEKQDALKTQECVVGSLTDEMRDIVERYIYLNTPWTCRNGLERMIEHIAEDVVIHHVDDEQDWMQWGHVCFPNGWYPEERVNQSFSKIHEPVIGFNHKVVPQVLRAIMEKGPHERYFWGLSHDEVGRINFHPDIPRAEFDPKNPKVHVRYEEQRTIPFPEHNMFMFTIRQGWIEPKEIHWAALADAVINMSPEHKEWKGITKELEAYLHQEACLELGPDMERDII